MHSLSRGQVLHRLIPPLDYASEAGDPFGWHRAPTEEARLGEPSDGASQVMAIVISPEDGNIYASGTKAGKPYLVAYTLNGTRFAVRSDLPQGEPIRDLMLTQPDSSIPAAILLTSRTVQVYDRFR